MQSSRLFFSSLAASLFLMIIPSLKVNAQTSITQLEQALRSYQSQIWDTDGVSPGITEFSKSSDGSFGGSYTMKDSTEEILGALSECQAAQTLVMHCAWTDQYGTGAMEVTFSENFSSFSGYWGEGVSELTFPWSGSR